MRRHSTVTYHDHVAAAPDPRSAADDLEQLLAEALAQFDQGGEAALAAFVQAHPKHATALQRGIRRCRDMGLLGQTPATAAAPERLGEFRLLRRLGGGGMGVVHEAVQEGLDRRVALKVIRPELLFFEGARERFRREIDAIASLDHPAIVKVFAAGEHEGVPYFTMELLDGLDVEQVCSALRGRDPAELRGQDLRDRLQPADGTGELFAGSWWEVAVRITQQVALGLRHAHVRGIVHRDVKPSNVVVTPHGRVVVLDFGVAQMRAGSDLTRTGAAVGSPAFMSPEQRRGEATDERTDVFSLAATCWQLLALQRPFRGDGGERGVETLPVLHKQNRAVPRELELVLQKALDPQRERRYGDMAAFAADLQAVLARRPIAARPLGMGLRTLRWCQRHRTLATALGVAVGAALVMLAALFVVQRAAQDALATEQARTRASLDTSLEALNSVVVRLGNEQLRAVPQADTVAHQVLQDAATLFRGLLQQHPGDAQVQWRAARALHALAMSHERRGEVDASFATVREAIAAVGAEPTDAERDVRAHARMTLASWLVDRRDTAAAREQLDLAEAEFLRLAADPRRAAEVLRSRAEISTTRSLLFDERTQPAEVEQALRQTIALHRECAAAGRPDAKDPALSVMAVSNLGKFLQRQDRVDEARPVLEEALVMAKALPERGTWPPASVYVAEVQDALGSALQKAKDPGAETLLRDSVAARRQAVELFPSNAEFRVRLGGTLHNLGRLVYAAGERTGEALALFAEARDHQLMVLKSAPRHAIANDFLAKHLEMVGICQSVQHDGVALAATAKALGEVPNQSPLVALRAADLTLRARHWLGGSDPALLDAAMALLLVAEQRGLSAAQLPKRGFEALAEREDFAQWQERVRARGK